MSLIGGLLFWLLMTGWVANDAYRRHRRWFGWAALVWFTNVIGLVAWSIARGRAPVLERPGVWRRLAVGVAAGVPLLLCSIVVSGLTVTFLFQPARNLGAAMEPTLDNEDQLIVNKLVYRSGDAQPGDIALMRYPLNPSLSFVKRIIARQGDTVRIVDGRVSVNDVPLTEPYVPPQFRGHDDWGPTIVPEGSFFVLGDHRTNSSDSRQWGYVPRQYILGKVVARLGGARGLALFD